MLTEQELVCVDLTQAQWPTIPSPYLKSIDCSQVTAAAHLEVPPALMTRLSESVQAPTAWPVQGGKLPASTDDTDVDLTGFTNGDLVVLGHDSGDISCWALGAGNTFRCLGRVRAQALFDEPVFGGAGAQEACNGGAPEAWPPFRPVGETRTQPVAVEPVEGDQGPDEAVPAQSRFAITSLTARLDTEAGELTLLVGTAGGSASVWSTATPATAFEADIARFQVDLITNPEQYAWEGPAGLKVVEGAFTPAADSLVALKPIELVQMSPPSAISAFGWHSGWQALAVGNAHGFAVVDLASREVVYKKLTLGMEATAALGAVGSVTEGAFPFVFLLRFWCTILLHGPLLFCRYSCRWRSVKGCGWRQAVEGVASVLVQETAETASCRPACGGHRR